ncbi:lactonase family protein [Janibacter sp. G56]|uniref:lactonase family protein n=1 Tax=Janibacter sp. G56 TaxID=3418717 RepID=UPI003D021C91
MTSPTPPVPDVDPRAERLLWVGGYTPEMGGTAPGLTAWVVPSDVGPSRPPRRVAVVPGDSPSYVVAAEGLVVAAHETTPGRVSATRPGSKEPLSVTVDAGGEGPAHVAVAGGHAVLAHYAGGSVSAVELSADGRLGEVTGSVTFAGSGPHPDRQRSAHPHQVVVDLGGGEGTDSGEHTDGHDLLVADLGTDRIHRVRLAADGSLTDLDDPIVLPAGSGPRHLVRTGDLVVVVCELTSSLWVARREDGSWHETDHRSTLAKPLEPGWTSDAGVGNLPAAICLVETGPGTTPDATVLVTNRGADTVAVFTLDRASGTVHCTGDLPAAGTWPRDALVDGDLLWVANERSDGVAALRWRLGDDAPAGARLGDVVARIDTGSPTGLALT